MSTNYVFEFSRSFQFTEEEIKEYIVKHKITDIQKITIEDLIHFTATKYKISGWGENYLDDNSTNNEDDFINACSEILEDIEEGNQ
jgi:hypothetical protein